MTNKEPLDKKIEKRQLRYAEINYLKFDDVKSSISNLKKRLKEESLNLPSETCGEIMVMNIDKLFSEEIGEGLLL